ncbi:type II RES/Xre toxin-antitoxin system antitoxin [Spirosoma aureum]|nr:antitoxin Xre-like helix-turn-helix domain-containing protein [Spirosoma aureum]
MDGKQVLDKTAVKPFDVASAHMEAMSKFNSRTKEIQESLESLAVLNTKLLAQIQSQVAKIQALNINLYPDKWPKVDFDKSFAIYQWPKFEIDKCITIGQSRLTKFSSFNLTAKSYSSVRSIHRLVCDFDILDFDLSPVKAPDLTGLSNLSGIKWSALSTPNTLSQPAEPNQYDELLTHIGNAFGYAKHLSDFSIKAHDHNSAAEAECFRLKLEILAAQELLLGLNKVLGTLVKLRLPNCQPPSPTNFVKDNKMPAPDDDHIKRDQLPLSMAEDLADVLDLTDKEMATILTISIRTYHRLKQKGLLNPVASERLLMLKDLAEYGLEVFEDQSNFNEWLRFPLQELSNNSPLNLLDTATGIARIKTILGRIDYGVFS